MPFRDGTGPRKLGRGLGCGRKGGGAGIGGECVCPNCGASNPHQRGTPCSSLTCTKCGSRMVRSE